MVKKGKAAGKAVAKGAKLISGPVEKDVFNEAEHVAEDAAGQAARSAGKRNVPHGFRDFQDFKEFGEDLNNGLRGKYPDAESAFQGSSVTGRSHDTGEPFDLGRTSDYDIAVSGRSLVDEAQRHGIEFRSGGRNTPPLTDADLAKLGLDDLAGDLGQKAGRKVNFMIYRTMQEALDAKPSIRVWF